MELAASIILISTDCYEILERWNCTLPSTPTRKGFRATRYSIPSLGEQKRIAKNPEPEKSLVLHVCRARLIKRISFFFNLNTKRWRATQFISKINIFINNIINYIFFNIFTIIIIIILNYKVIILK